MKQTTDLDTKAKELIEIISSKGVGDKSQRGISKPTAMIGADDLIAHQLRNSEMINKVIDINIDLDRDFNYNTTQF